MTDTATSTCTSVLLLLLRCHYNPDDAASDGEDDEGEYDKGENDDNEDDNDCYYYDCRYHFYNDQCYK